MSKMDNVMSGVVNKKCMLLYDEQLEQQLLGSILIENKVLQLIELQIKKEHSILRQTGEYLQK